MIISRLQGGLGNQMFQYALGRRLALDRNVPLKLDLRWYRSHTDRCYLLNRFNISADIASTEEIKQKQILKNRKLGKISEAVLRHSPFYYLFPTVREKNISFDPHILKARTDAYFIGYWQSEYYFKSISPTIQTDYQLKNPLSNESLNFLQLIKSTTSISVHIRRGNYLNNPRHGTCSLDYYQNAHNFILCQFRNPDFFIFSDDLKWAKENLNNAKTTHFVDLKTAEKDVEELILMSTCKHQIIANSTYSWWGAWLNTNPYKVVIAPKQWSTDSKQDTSKLIPKSWIQL